MKIAATTISDAPGLIREKAKERAKALAIPYLEKTSLKRWQRSTRQKVS